MASDPELYELAHRVGRKLKAAGRIFRRPAAAGPRRWMRRASPFSIISAARVAGGRRPSN